MLDTNVAQWKKMAESISKKYNDLTPGEREAFEALCEQWKLFDFDASKCDKLLEQLKKDKNKHPAGQLSEDLAEFRGICTKYYVKGGKEVFDAFQKAMGGKQKRASTGPKPAPKPAPKTSTSSSEEKKTSNPPLVYEGGAYYEGESRNGKRHGRGTYHYSDGDWETGTWANNLKEGFCTCFYGSRNRKDEGEFHANKRSGRGTMTWNNGARYEGQWSDEGRHGKGRYTNPNGEWYDGEWLNDKMTGQGSYYFPQYKRTDTGRFVDGDIVGRASIKWGNGHSYEGTWKIVNGERVGEGTYTYANGSKERGRWVKGTWKKHSSWDGAFWIFRMAADGMGAVIHGLVWLLGKAMHYLWVALPYLPWLAVLGGVVGAVMDGSILTAIITGVVGGVVAFYAMGFILLGQEWLGGVTRWLDNLQDKFLRLDNWVKSLIVLGLAVLIGGSSWYSSYQARASKAKAKAAMEQIVGLWEGTFEGSKGKATLTLEPFGESKVKGNIRVQFKSVTNEAIDGYFSDSTIWLDDVNANNGVLDGTYKGTFNATRTELRGTYTNSKSKKESAFSFAKVDPSKVTPEAPPAKVQKPATPKPKKKPEAAEEVAAPVADTASGI
jgi:hypothetical protein